MENQRCFLQLTVVNVNYNGLVLPTNARMNCSIPLQRGSYAHAAVKTICPPSSISALDPARSRRESKGWTTHGTQQCGCSRRACASCSRRKACSMAGRGTPYSCASNSFAGAWPSSAIARVSSPRTVKSKGVSVAPPIHRSLPIILRAATGSQADTSTNGCRDCVPAHRRPTFPLNQTKRAAAPPSNGPPVSQRSLITACRSVPAPG